jgi:hypothetical protein
MGYNYQKHIEESQARTAKGKQVRKSLGLVENPPEPPKPEPDTTNDKWIHDKTAKITQPESYYKVLLEVSKGKTLSRVCGFNGLPTYHQLRYAIMKDEEFKKEYEVAMRLQCDAYADEMIAIADNLDQRGTYNKVFEDGSQGKLEHVKQVDRDRLSILTRQWLIARRLPKVYGDSIRQEISNDLQNIKPVINIIKT